MLYHVCIYKTTNGYKLDKKLLEFNIRKSSNIELARYLEAIEQRAYNRIICQYSVIGK